MFNFRSFICKLPDKGEKIQILYNRVIQALDTRNKVEDASRLLSSLNIGSNNLNNLEWEGTTQTSKKLMLDSDDDEGESNPFEILLAANISQNKKIIKHKIESNDIQLITEQDIREAKEIENEHPHFDPAADKICRNEILEPSQRFLPYKSTEKKGGKIIKHIYKIREITAATPPILEKGVVMLSLRESIEAEFLQQKLTKELIEKHTTERLEAKTMELKKAGLKISQPSQIIPRISAPGMTKYRLPASIEDDDCLFGNKDDGEDDSEDCLTDEEYES